MTATIPTPAQWMPAFRSAIAAGAKPRPDAAITEPFVCCACEERHEASYLAGWVTAAKFDEDWPLQGVICSGCCADIAEAKS